MGVNFLTRFNDHLGELVAHYGILLGEVHDAEGELESGVGLGNDDGDDY